MTCVIGLETPEGVWIGADSAGTDEYGGQTLRADTKVFRHGPMLFGFCGSYRMGQLLRYQLELSAQPYTIEDYEYMVRYFIEDVRHVLNVGGFTWIEKNVETGGQFVVAYNNKLYSVEEDFQVGISSRDYVCIGSGGDVASGAMAALADTELTPTNQIKKALKIASKHDAYVAPPFVVMKL